MLEQNQHCSLPPNGAATSGVWTCLRCSRCRYMREHPGPVTVADLDGECGLCRAPLGAVTVFRVAPHGGAGQ